MITFTSARYLIKYDLIHNLLQNLIKLKKSDFVTCMVINSNRKNILYTPCIHTIFQARLC